MSDQNRLQKVWWSDVKQTVKKLTITTTTTTTFCEGSRATHGNTTCVALDMWHEKNALQAKLNGKHSFFITIDKGMPYIYNAKGPNSPKI